MTLRRVEPRLKVVLGLDPRAGEPVVLHAGNRRLEAIALKARRLRLNGGDPLLPRSIRELLAGPDACRNNHRCGRWQYAGAAVIDDVDVVAADQHRRRALNAFEPLFRVE